jgi:uncharacterized protein
MKVPLPVKNAEVRLLLKSRPSFLADAMLGSIARKLRIFGFDTIYIAHIDDDDILKIAAEQDRIILTCDRDLFKRVVKKRAKGVLLESNNDIENIAHILAKNAVSSLNFNKEYSRCPICNGLMIRKKATEIQDCIVHLRVIESHKDFFQCTVCSKVYWEGSHSTRIIHLAENIDNKIKQQFKYR